MIRLAAQSASLYRGALRPRADFASPSLLRALVSARPLSKLSKLEKLEKADLRDLRSSRGGSVALSSQAKIVHGTGTLLDGRNLNIDASLDLSQTTSSSNKRESYSLGLGGVACLSTDISGTGTPLDGTKVHASCNGSLGGRVETVNANGAAGSDKSIFLGVGVKAGFAKDVASVTSSSGKSSASVGVSGSAAAGCGLDSSQGRSIQTSLYASVHVHGQATTQISETRAAGVHGSVGVSTLGYEGSAGGHTTSTTGNVLSSTTDTHSATASFVNGVPTTIKMSTSTSQNGLVCSEVTTSSLGVGLTSLSTTSTTSREGIFFDEASSTTTSLSICGVEEKRTSSTTTSSHVNGALVAGLSQGVQEIASRGVTGEGVKNVVLASGKSMVGSVAKKAAQTAMKCPTSAGVVVATSMSLASNSIDLCDPSKRKAAMKAVAKDTSRSVCAGLAAKALAGRAPGAVGAAVQVAASVPDIVEALANGDNEAAAKITAQTATTAGGAWAGAEGGAMVGACFGPVGAVVGGTVGGICGSLAAGWLWS